MPLYLIYFVTMPPFTKNAIGTMMSKGRGKVKLVVEASKMKNMQECMRIELTDGD